MRNNYWSCSKLADKIRIIKKLKSATATGWANWKIKAETEHPIRYWIADEGLDHLQDFVFWIPNRLHNIQSYIDNRFISKTHALVAHKNHLKRGQWCDVDNRMLPCLFDSLVDFVETDLAPVACYNNENYKIPFWYKLPFAHWRSRDAGIENLKWQMALIKNEDNGYYDKNDSEYGKPTEQAKNAKEILDLYLWWKDIYPNRPDPYDISEWSAYCEEKRSLRKDKDLLASFDDQDDPLELKEKGEKALELLQKIEMEYENEDTENLIRLIKVRHSLWT